MAALPAWVAPYIGLPYRELGRDRDGLDCWGLFELVQREIFGRDLPAYHGPRWRKGCDAQELGQAAAAYAAQFLRVDQEAALAGDGILLRMRGAPIHIAVALGGGWMLHIEEGADSCVESFGGYQWKNRIMGAYRYV